jgi:CheY-like chemotaxis protein
VLVGARRRQGKVVFQVWDTGIGIALKDQARIFEEFARAENVPLGSGMGLGLSVVERACRHLGHRLWVQSKPGHGSVFNMELDVIEAQHDPAEPRMLVRHESEQSLDQIVLVLENDRDVLFGMTRWLEQNGASVLGASTRAEALSFVSDMGMPPDIILADYQLDEGDTGLAAVEALRAACDQYVPAILITADRSEGLRRKAAQMNIAVLTKPVKLSRLRPLIDWNLFGHRIDRASNMRLQTKVGNDS